MKRISAQSIQEVNARADAHSVIGEYVRLDKKGGRYWGLCPFHNEKTPSFSVDPDHNLFYCFGCGKGGSVITFLMELEKYSYVEAIEKLAAKFAVTLVWEGNYDAAVEAAKTDEKAAMRELYTRVSRSFSHWLLKRPEGAACLEYLKSRGISDESIDNFCLGYAPAPRRWLHQFLLTKGYSADFLAKTGLFSRNYPDSSFFSDRLIFPIADREGRVVAFGGRLLNGEGPKYLNSPESEIFHKGDNLYALDRALPTIRKTGIARICEGYMDVIALHQVGILNAVAPLGTAFTPPQAKLLKRWCSAVHLVMDADGAGENGTIKAIRLCREAGLECKVVRVSGGKDPAEILQTAGPQALQKALDYCINDFDYLIEYARANYGLSTAEGKSAAAKFLFPFLASIDTEVARSSLMDTIADRFGVDRNALARDFRLDASRTSERRDTHAREESARVSSSADIPKVSDELFLMMSLVVNRPLFRKVRSLYAPEDLESGHARDLFVALEESFRAERVDIDFLLERLESPPLRAFVLAQHTLDVYTRHPERIVDDGIMLLKRKRLEARSDELVRRLRMASSEGADEGINELLLEKKHVDDTLKQLQGLQLVREQDI